MIQIEGADPDVGTFMFSESSHGQAESQKVSSTLARNFFPPKDTGGISPRVYQLSSFQVA